MSDHSRTCSTSAFGCLFLSYWKLYFSLEILQLITLRSINRKISTLKFYDRLLLIVVQLCADLFYLHSSMSLASPIWNILKILFYILKFVIWINTRTILPHILRQPVYSSKKTRNSKSERVHSLFSVFFYLCLAISLKARRTWRSGY